MDQTPAFEFIQHSNVTFGTVHVDKEQRRRARVAVMKNYRQNLVKPKTSSSSTKVKLEGGVKAHTSRYRLPPLPSHTLNSQQPEDSDPHEPSDISRRSSPVSSDSSIPRLFDPVCWCIEVPGVETRRLCQYYLTSYWTNSVAVNPNGEWTIFTLANPAMAHAKLSLVALHIAHRTGETNAAHLYHRGQAMRILNDRLVQDSKTIDDSTLGSIAILTSLDIHSDQSVKTIDTHMTALASLVETRGGIDSPTISDHLRRVLGWVDLLHSAVNQRKPFLGKSQVATMATQDEIRAAAGMDIKPPPLSQSQQSQPLKSLSRALQQLALLIKLKPLISTVRNRRLRALYSNSLWSLESDLLALEDASRGPSLWSQRDAVRAFRDAALICTYSSLRQQNNIVLFNKLMQRVQMYISPLLEVAKAGKKTMSTDELKLLLWVLFMGYKAADLVNKDGDWFSQGAVEVALRHGLEHRILPEIESGDADYLRLGLEESDIEQLQIDLQKQMDPAF